MRREVVAVGRDIRYIKGPSEFASGGASLRESAWFWILLLLPVAANAGIWIRQRRAEHLAANVGLFRRRGASRAARERLKRARSLMVKSDEAAFFAEVDRAVTGYLADKFDESAIGLTRERVVNLLEARSVPEDLRRRTISCLERCDFGRFAARPAGRDQVTALLGQAEEVISSLERALA